MFPSFFIIVHISILSVPPPAHRLSCHVNGCYFRHRPCFAHSLGNKWGGHEHTCRSSLCWWFNVQVFFQRNALSSKNLTKVTLESFVAWKKRKLREKKTKLAEEDRRKRTNYKTGKQLGLSGRDLFTFNPDLVGDDDDEADDGVYEIEEGDNSLQVMTIVYRSFTGKWCCAHYPPTTVLGNYANYCSDSIYVGTVSYIYLEGYRVQYVNGDGQNPISSRHQLLVMVARARDNDVLVKNRVYHHHHLRLSVGASHRLITSCWPCPRSARASRPDLHILSSPLKMIRIVLKYIYFDPIYRYICSSAHVNIVCRQIPAGHTLCPIYSFVHHHHLLSNVVSPITRRLGTQHI
jgi:hypothetical protein